MLGVSGIVFAFFSMVFYGVGDSLLKIPSRVNSGTVILFYQSVFMGIFALIVMICGFTTTSLFTLSWVLIFPVAAAVSEIIAIMFLVKSMQLEKVGLSIAIAASFPLLVTPYGYFFFDERLRPIVVLFIIFSVIGIVLTSLETVNTRKIQFNTRLRFAFMAMFFWASLAICMKHSSYYYNPIDSTVIISLASFVAIAAFVMFSRKRALEIRSVTMNSLGWILTIATLIFCAVLTSNAAYTSSDGSIVAAIVASAGALTAVIAMIFYRERFQVHQYVGIMIVLASLIVLNYFS